MSAEPVEGMRTMRAADAEIERLTRMRRFLRGTLKRDPQTGCLLYTGGRRGPSLGNPLLADKRNGRNTTHHLRSWIWTIHRGPPPRGRFVVMACGVFNCHEPSHMRLSGEKIIYRTVYAHFRSRLTEEDIRAIRFFQRKVSVAVLSRVFVPSPYLIRRIQQGQVRPDVQSPRGYHPSAEILRRVSRESLKSSRRYMTDAQVRDARAAIRRSDLSDLHKRLLLEKLEGKTVRAIAREGRLSRDRINVFTRQALSLLKKDHKHEEWLPLLSFS
jgi:hypothetical protein